MKKLVILTGAGISQESGIRTFRDTGGLWEGHDVMEVASPDGWKKNRELVLNFYNQRHNDCLKVKPNKAHKGLVDLEKDFDVTIITQNVDDLHERAGSKNVIHLHGQLNKKRSSLNPQLIYDWGTEDILIGDKAEDGSQIRPHIVWFGESVPKMWEATLESQKADIFVVIGTSLQVYPAAGLISHASDECPKFIIDVNIPSTMVSNVTEIEAKASDGVKQLKKLLKKLK
jgi:NAD-dependent deacetylase